MTKPEIDTLTLARDYGLAVNFTPGMGKYAAERRAAAAALLAQGYLSGTVDSCSITDAGRKALAKPSQIPATPAKKRER